MTQLLIFIILYTSCQKYQVSLKVLTLHSQRLFIVFLHIAYALVFVYLYCDNVSNNETSIIMLRIANNEKILKAEDTNNKRCERRNEMVVWKHSWRCSCVKLSNFARVLFGAAKSTASGVKNMFGSLKKWASGQRSGKCSPFTTDKNDASNSVFLFINVEWNLPRKRVSCTCALTWATILWGH